jgi:hypothetical protein
MVTEEERQKEDKPPTSTPQTNADPKGSEGGQSIKHASLECGQVMESISVDQSLVEENMVSGEA